MLVHAKASDIGVRNAERTDGLLHEAGGRFQVSRGASLLGGSPVMYYLASSWDGTLLTCALVQGNMS